MDCMGLKVTGVLAIALVRVRVPEAHKAGSLPCLMGCLYESWFAATSRQLPGGEGFF